MQSIGEDLQYDPNELLGRGQFAHVYEGRYKGVPVAVKRVLFEDIENVNVTREELALSKCAGHPNVVKLYDVKDSGSFRFYVLELCSASLDQLFLRESDPRKFRGSMPPDKDVLLQILNGLDHIHSKNIVHRDIKPGNILISQSSSSPHCSVKLADFGLSKQTTANGSYSQSGLNRGTFDWMAPEYLQLSEVGGAGVLPRGSILGDIFSSGCVLFYYVTRGFHPFGEGFLIPSNILQSNPVNLNKLMGGLFRRPHFSYKIVAGMIRPKPIERLSLKAAIQMLTGPGRKFDFKLTKIIHGTTRSPAVNVVFNPVRPLAALYFGHDKTIVILKGEKDTDPLDSWKEIKRIDFDGYCPPQWNANGTQLAIGVNFDDLVIWSIDDDQLRRLEHIDFLYWVWNPFNPNLLLLRTASSLGRTFRVVDTSIMTLTGTANAPSFWSMTINPCWISSAEFLVPPNGGGIERWEVKKTMGGMELECTLQKPLDYEVEGARYNDALKMVAFIASANERKRRRIELWPSDMSGDEPRRLALDGECYTMSWCPSRTGSSDSYLACGMEGGSVLIWRVTKEIPAGGRDDFFRLRESPAFPFLIQFSPDGLFMATFSYIRAADQDWNKIHFQGVRPLKSLNHFYQQTWDATGRKFAIEKDGVGQVIEISSSQ